MIPKWILHPFLLLCGGALIFALVWQDLPKPEQIKQAVVNIPPQSECERIGDFVDGQLILPTGPIRINDERFTNLNPQQTEVLQIQFTGQWIRRSAIHNHLIDLPLELFDPHCFETPAWEIHCPLIIQP